MTLRTVNYDDSTHKIVPIEPSEDQLFRMQESLYDVRKIAWYDGVTIVYKSGISAAPEYQEPENPLDTPLPCDIKVGCGTIRKGCKLSTLVIRMNAMYDLIMKYNSAIAPSPRMNEPWTNEEKTDLKSTLSGVFNWNQEPTKDE